MSRFVYQLEVPPSPASLAAIQASLAAILLTVASIPGLLRPSEPQQHRAAPGNHAEAESSRGAGRRARFPGLAAILGADTVGRAGAELGCWTFLANAATITAFQHTPASRGAFLIRQASWKSKEGMWMGWAGVWVWKRRGKGGVSSNNFANLMHCWSSNHLGLCV